MGCKQSNLLVSSHSQSQSIQASVWDQDYDEIVQPDQICSKNVVSKEVFVDYESLKQQLEIKPQHCNEKDSQIEKEFQTDSQDQEDPQKSEVALDKIISDKWQLERVLHILSQFKKDQFKLLMMNNTIYYGEIKEHQYNGQGILIYGDTIYYGGFMNGQFDGSGILEQKNGYYFNGDFKFGIKVLQTDLLKTGVGKEIFQNGLTRTGNFSQGQLSGELCTINSPDGSVYEGAVRQNQRHGFGEINYSDGRSYRGDWKDDVIQGFGTYIYGPGKKYEGQFLNGLRDGMGHFWWPDGTQYIGQFSQGRQSGIGTLIDRRGVSQDYWWEEGRRLQRCDQSTKQSF